MHMPTIVWFNVPAGETDRARAFYEEVFAWTTEPFVGMEGAFEITTGGIGGEILPRTYPGEPITVFVGVPSIEEHAARVEQAVVPYETTVNNVVEIASGCSRLIATRGHGFPPGIAMTAPPLGAGEEAGRGGG